MVSQGALSFISSLETSLVLGSLRRDTQKYKPTRRGAERAIVLLADLDICSYGDRMSVSSSTAGNWKVALLSA